MSLIRHRPFKFRSLKLLSQSAISTLSKPATSLKYVLNFVWPRYRRAESCVYVNVSVHSFAAILLGRGLIRGLRLSRGRSFPNPICIEIGTIDGLSVTQPGVWIVHRDDRLKMNKLPISSLHHAEEDNLRVQDRRGGVIVSACGTLAWFWLPLPFSVLLRLRRSPLRPVRSRDM